MGDKLEFLRQRDRLKMMTPATERSKVSADDMINNLLQKSDTFKKVTEDIPQWAQCGSPTVCPYYESIWSLVKCSDKMVDTQRISQLLLTSGLHPDALGFIWNLANKSVPGQLTKQELFIVLALVGLAQTGRAFNNLSVLKFLTSAPIPRLAVSLPTMPGHVPVQVYQPIMAATPVLPAFSSNQLQPNLLTSSVSQSSVLDDEFQDFQSCPMPEPSSRSMNINSVPGSLYSKNPLLISSITALTSPPTLSITTLQTSSPHQTLSVTPALSNNPPLAAPSTLPKSSSNILPSLLPCVTEAQQIPTLETIYSNLHSSKLFFEGQSVFEQPYLDHSVSQANQLQFPVETNNSGTSSAQEHLVFQNKSVLEETYLDHPVLDQPNLKSIPSNDIPVPPSNVIALDKFSAQSLTYSDQSKPLHNTEVLQTSAQVPEDEFTDFQSVSAGNYPDELLTTGGISVDSFSDFQAAVVQPPKTPIPKLPSSIKVSPESERKLRNLAQPESLSSLPESKISSRNQVSSMPTIAVLSGSRGIGNRLANHSLGTKSEKQHQKHIKIKPMGMAPSCVLPESLFPKCTSKSNSSFLLKETKIPSCDFTEELEPTPHIFSELTRRIEIPSVGTFQETTLPVDIKSPEASNELSLKSCDVGEEDRYSALRGIDLTGPNKDDALNDDFGDYLSAELESEKAAEAWTAWNSSIVEPTSEGSIGPVFENIPEIGGKLEVDLLGSSFDVEADAVDIHGDFSQLEIKPEFATDDDFGEFITPTFEEKTVPSLCLAPNDDSASIKSREGSTPSMDLGLTRHGSWSSLELSGQSLSRKGSVPSLDFKVEGPSPNVASRCHECCLRLLKEAVVIFDNVSDKTVLQEIFMTSEARNYMKYLQVVYYISRRISLSGSGSRSVQETINAQWQKLQLLAVDFSIPLMDCEEVLGAGLSCAVCKGPTSSSDLEQDGVWYHISCANLWVNCIDTSLPCH